MKNVIHIFVVMMVHVAQASNNTILHNITHCIESKEDSLNDFYARTDIPQSFKDLIYYIQTGQVEFALKIIPTIPSADLDYLDIHDSLRHSALMIAIKQGYEEIALKLVEYMTLYGLGRCNMQAVDACMYAQYYGMLAVEKAIEQKFKGFVGIKPYKGNDLL